MMSERTYMKLTHPKDGTVLIGIEYDTIVTGEGWAGVFVGEKADDTMWKLRKQYGVKVERFDG